MSKKIAITLLLSLATTAIHAETCKSANNNLPFRQVVLNLFTNGGVRCDYGPEFDFQDSYTLQGHYKPAGGPWGGASDPYTKFCKGKNNECIFKSI